MSLRLFNGFETPRLNFFPGSACTYEVGRTGKCINMPQGGANATVGFPMSNLTEFVLGFAWRRKTRTNSNDTTVTILSLVDTQDTTLSITHDYNTGVVSLSRMAGLSTVFALGACSVPLPIDIWAYIELHWKASTMADPGVGGIIELKFDGNVVFRYDGDTTRWSQSISSLEWEASQFSATQVDDFYILDMDDATATQGRPFNDYLGPVRIEALRPNAAGDSTQWGGSDGNSIDNHLLVDDPDQPDTADYIEALETGKRDLYHFQDPTFAGKVLAIDVLSHCSAPDGGSPKIKSVVKAGTGEIAVGAGTVPAVAWATRTDTIHTLDPTGALWTTGKVAAAQFGVEMESI